jgi:hypothetical protein
LVWKWSSVVCPIWSGLVKRSPIHLRSRT